MNRLLIALLGIFLCQGCTTLSLKRQTLRQADSAVDLRYREVMENLAIMKANPATLPAFSSIFSGTTNITDTIPCNLNNAISVGKAGATPTYGFTMDYPVTRAVTQNWTLDPTVAPEKLRAMRCACWWVLFGPECQFEDCSTLERYEDGAPAGYYFDVADKLRAIPPGWVHSGCRHDVPKCAYYVANCGGTYVWVMPQDMECLTSFLLVIQGIARVADDSVYFPKVNTTKVVLDLGKTSPETAPPHLMDGWSSGQPEKALDTPYVSKVTVYVDEEGWATPGPGISSLPRKARFDNVGIASDLKSAILAAIKGP